MVKWLRRAAWVLTFVFIIFVVIPLFIERMSLSDVYRSIFASFHLDDEQGRMHNGWLGQGQILGSYGEGFHYGYQAPEGMDLSPWRRTVGIRDYEHALNGFYWSDNGFLWAGVGKTSKDKTFFQEGRNLGVELRVNDQSQAMLPGAPMDSKTPHLSVFGHFPEYKLLYEDEYFKFDFLCRANAAGWCVAWGDKPFRAGDFGLGTYSELPYDVTGTIVHKKAEKHFQVQGSGLLEDALGLPYSWWEWGGHDWLDFHFPNGWSGTIQNAYDDWQWGYNRHPTGGWIYDPDNKKFYTFYRVELVDKVIVEDELNSGFDYPETIRWRAFAAEGTVEIFSRRISYAPILRKTLWFRGPNMSYGSFATEGHFIRRDGATIEFKNGRASMEHFLRFFPDFRYTAPVLMILMVLTWGGASITKRRNENRPWFGPLMVTVLCLLGVVVLYWLWRAQAWPA